MFHTIIQDCHKYCMKPQNFRWAKSYPRFAPSVRLLHFVPWKLTIAQGLSKKFVDFKEKKLEKLLMLVFHASWVQVNLLHHYLIYFFTFNTMSRACAHNSWHAPGKANGWFEWQYYAEHCCPKHIWQTKYFTTSLYSCLNLNDWLLCSSRLLPNKLTGPQLVKGFLALYETWRHVIAVKSVRHLTLPWARST